MLVRSPYRNPQLLPGRLVAANDDVGALAGGIVEDAPDVSVFY